MLPKRTDTLAIFPNVTKEHAVSEIQRIAQDDTGKIFILDHAHMRMIERGITTRQILKVLRHGEVIDGPTWVADKERGWKCEFKRISAGECLHVIAKLTERGDNCCLIITVYWR